MKNLSSSWRKVCDVREMPELLSSKKKFGKRPFQQDLKSEISIQSTIKNVKTFLPTPPHQQQNLSNICQQLLSSSTKQAPSHIYFLCLFFFSSLVELLFFSFLTPSFFLPFQKKTKKTGTIVITSTMRFSSTLPS